MCFTPIVSITIAIVEFILVATLLLFFPRTKLRNFFAIFIVVLGFYQFSEYMLCSSGNGFLWAIIGIITYSFLPALGLHAVLRIFNKKLGLLWVYIVPVAVSAAAIFIPGFVIRAECEEFFIYVSTIMTLRDSLVHTIPYLIYLLYYAGFIIISCFIIYKHYAFEKNHIKRKIELVEIFGVVSMTVPAFILIVIFPTFSLRFQSVLCEFAIFVAIAAFVGAYLESKLYLPKKND